MIKRTKSGRSWTKLAGIAALGYCLLAMSIVLIEYVSESKKLSRGFYTDTFSPLIWSEVTTWPTSMFIANWPGYPYRFDQPVWQKMLKDSLPSHLGAAVVQAILVFLVVKGLGAASVALKRPTREPDSS
jgi:hypothetical protein